MIYAAATLISVSFACFMYRAGEKTLVGTEGSRSRYIKQTAFPPASRHKYSYFLMVCCWLPLFLLSGLRWGVGTDFFGTYLAGYSAVARGRPFPWEAGYVFLNQTVSWIAGDPAGIFILTSFVFLTFTFKAIYDSSADIRLSVLLLVADGFYFQSMNGIRQWITLAMFLYSIKFIRDNKLVPYLIVILLASTVHLSALIFIPVYFLCRIRIPPRKGLLVLLVSIACMPFVRIAFNFFVSLTKYKWYLDTSYNKIDFSITDTIVGAVLLALGYFYYKNSEGDQTYSILMNLQLFALIFSVYSAAIFLADRLVPCFTASQLLLVPAVLSQEKSRKARVVLTFVIFVFFILTCYYTYGVLGWSDILPYRSVFSR